MEKIDPVLIFKPCRKKVAPFQAQAVRCPKRFCVNGASELFYARCMHGINVEVIVWLGGDSYISVDSQNFKESTAKIERSYNLLLLTRYSHFKFFRAAIVQS